MVFPSAKLAKTYNETYLHENYSYTDDDGYTRRTFDKYNASHGETKTVSTCRTPRDQR